MRVLRITRTRNYSKQRGTQTSKYRTNVRSEEVQVWRRGGPLIAGPWITSTRNQFWPATDLLQICSSNTPLAALPASGFRYCTLFLKR